MTEHGPVRSTIEEPDNGAHRPTWAEGRITVDEGQTVVDGEYRTDLRWNGWLCVRLTLDNAISVLTALAAQESGTPDALTFATRGDAIAVREHGLEPEIYEPDSDGMYDLGSGAWCWERAEERNDVHAGPA